MRYLLLIYGDQSQIGKRSPADEEAEMAHWYKYTMEMEKAGISKGGEALKPTNTATTVRVRNGKTVHTDGPFAETKEQLGGYYILDTPNLDEAIKWAAKCPAAFNGSIELRPIMEIPPQK